MLEPEEAYLERFKEALAPRYRVDRKLGEGGMAVVYLASDVLDGREVAIKVFKPGMAALFGPNRFALEIQIVKDFSHPNILPLYDSGEAAGLLYYVMRRIGETLKERIKKDTQLSVDRALRFARDVADALSYAHSHGIIHRDIKPGNILIEGDRAIVADFGIARIIDPKVAVERTDSGVAMGTPEYMSPEQANADRSVDARSDLYSLGCVLYEMLAGVPPFRGATAQAVFAMHRGQAPSSVRVVRPDLPVGLDEIVQTALAKAPAGRQASAEQFVQEIDACSRLQPRPGHRLWPRFAVALVLLATVAGVLVQRARQPLPVPDLLAIAPFDVRVPGLGAYWSEGLASIVSRDLGGTGGLRLVSPAVVAHLWKGDTDSASAAELGSKTGARLAVFGQVLPSGHDSVRLSAGVIDTRNGRVLAEVEARDAQDRIDRGADSLSFRLLVALNANRSIAGGRLASSRSTSFPAMKAFLQGEYFYRRSAWDSALAHYQRAVDLDSTFALALLRLSLVIGWQRAAWPVDSIERAYALEAGRLNRGLAYRDSLVVAAESLRAAVVTRWDDTLFQEHRSRLFAILDKAIQRYPGDPEIWYELGLARFLVPEGGSAEQVLEAFDRGIRLDSTFAPAYIYPVQQAMLVNGPAGARRYLSAYLALNPTDVHADGLRLAGLLLDSTRDEGLVARRLKEAPAEVLYHTKDALAWWVDSAETAVKVARLASGRSSANPLFVAERQLQLAIVLAYRGHIKEALAVMGDRSRHRALWSVLVTLGALPEEATIRQLHEIAVEPLWPPNGIIFAIPWWAARRDVASLRLVARRADSLARTTTHRLVGPYARLLATSATAHLLGAAGRSDDMLKELQRWNESACAGWDCYYMRLDRARLLAAHGRAAEAAALLDAETPKLYYPMAVLWRLERARLAAQLGRRDQAQPDYQYVIDAWAHADSQLQPWVAEARAALGEGQSDAARR